MCCADPETLLLQNHFRGNECPAHAGAGVEQRPAHGNCVAGDVCGRVYGIASLKVNCGRIDGSQRLNRGDAALAEEQGRQVRKIYGGGTDGSRGRCNPRGAQAHPIRHEYCSGRTASPDRDFLAGYQIRWASE